MNAPLIHFGNGYTVQRNGPGLRFTIGDEVRPTGLEFNDIVHHVEHVTTDYVNLIDQGSEQAQHIASLESYTKKLDADRPHMDTLLVRCKEWMLRKYDETVTDEEVGRMFDFCLQGHYIPTRNGLCVTETSDHYDNMVAAEQLLAQADAESVGMGFIVHGVRVSPDNVTVLDGCKPVDAMRQATAEAKQALAELREAVSPECHANAIECMNKRASAMGWINDFLGFGQGPDTSVEAACEWTLAGVRRVNKQLNELEVEAATVGPRLAQLCKLVGLTPPASKPAELYDMAFAILGLVNGKLRGWGFPMDDIGGHVDPAAHLTDPTKPITLDAPGVSNSCGVCGAIFEGEGMFCALHANADLLGL